MTHAFPRRARKSEGGSAAIEAAACIGFVLVPMLAFILLFGRYFWYYSVAQKAAHDAAVYMAGAPLSEIKSSKGAAGLAGDIVGWETADLDSGTSASMGFLAMCGVKLGFSTDIQWYPCSSSTTPVAVRASMTLTVTDPFLSPITNAVWGSDGIPIFAGVTMNYVGH